MEQVSITIATIMALLAITQTSLALNVNVNGRLSREHHSHKQSALRVSGLINDFLVGHNVARAAVGVPPVTWNSTLAAYAHAYVTKRSADCALQHSNGPYGENIAMGFGDMAPTLAVKLWVDERSHYDHESNSCNGGECLHYTQVVWRNTANIGCAKAKCNNGWMFVSCNYYPPGNYIGESPY